MICPTIAADCELLVCEPLVVCDEELELVGLSLDDTRATVAPGS